MIESFKIKNYKCFDEFEINNLGRINIFLGENNVGKSSILEAIFGYACGKQLSFFMDWTLFRLNRDRNINLYPLIEKVLNNFNNRNKLEFSFEGKVIEKEKKYTKKYTYIVEPGVLFGEIDVKLNENIIFVEYKDAKILDEIKKRNAKVLFKLTSKENKKIIEKKTIIYPFSENEFSIDTPFLAASIFTIDEYKDSGLENTLYSHLKRDSKKMERVLNDLKKSFKTNIEDIDMFPYPDGTPAPVSLKISSGKYIPLYEFGGGMRKWFIILANQILNKNTIQCLDEIGDMLHPRAQGNLGLNLSKISKENNNQIFATTQSLEFVSNYLSKVKEEDEKLLEDIKIITLKNIENEIKSRILSGKDALRFLEDNEMELR